MIATGIVRKVDTLGRIVIPKEIRNKLGIDYNTSIEIYVDGDYIVLTKYEKKCIICGKSENIVSYKDKTICNSCIELIKGLYNE